MHYWIAAFLAVIAIVVLGKCAEAAGCAASPREVWREHPHAHATWRLVNGHQCWRAGVPSARAGRGRHRSFGMAVSVPSFIPLPRPRAERTDRLTPAEGRALSNYLLGE